MKQFTWLSSENRESPELYSLVKQERGGDEMAIRYGRGDVKQTTTGFRDPRHLIYQKQIPIPGYKKEGLINEKINNRF